MMYCCTSPPELGAHGGAGVTSAEGFSSSRSHLPNSEDCPRRLSNIKPRSLFSIAIDE